MDTPNAQAVEKPAPIQPPVKPAAPVAAVKSNPPAQKTHPVKREKPAGWFSYSDNGIRAAVVANIKKSADLPEAFKKSLLEDIQSMDASLNFLNVHCHRHLQDGKMVTNCTIKGSAVAAS